jgi:6-pyruvoyltetrahydropterin/6-carboxytetrahydropterin synthase
MKYSYKFKFYLNARHYVVMNGVQSPIHPHTWEIELMIGVEQDDFIIFTNLEKKIESFLKIYNGKCLNDIEEQEDFDPTLENLGKYLFDNISNLIKDDNLILMKLEISENPTRTYIVERKIAEEVILSKSFVS